MTKSKVCARTGGKCHFLVPNLLPSSLSAMSSFFFALSARRAERLMEEVCIVIDEQDQVLGTGSKRKCTCNHAVDNFVSAKERILCAMGWPCGRRLIGSLSCRRHAVHACQTHGAHHPHRALVSQFILQYICECVLYLVRLSSARVRVAQATW